jgi:hypothetical protein
MIDLMQPMMKASRRFVVVLALLSAFLMPVSTTYAQDDEKPPTEARLENYPSKVTLDGGGAATSWILFIVLTGLTVLVMFKNANRTHLD